MIFGIKTKKDKRIEELEKQVEDLQYTAFLKTPVMCVNYDIIEVKAKSVMDEQLPTDFFKDELCRKLADYIKPFVTFDIYDAKEWRPDQQLGHHPEGRPRIMEATIRVGRGQSYSV